MLSKIRIKMACMKDKTLYVLRLRKSPKPVHFLVGTPDYRNLGDSAIAIAEKHMLSSTNEKRIIELTCGDIEGYYSKAINKIMFPWDTYFLQGGGNMGDEWFRDESLRRQFILKHRKNKIVIFPQTIYYTDTKTGAEKKNESVEIYNRKNVTLIARESVSFHIMKELYPKANVLLTPDIVLSLPHQKFEVQRNGILICLRKDVEKTLSDEQLKKIEQKVESMGVAYAYTDTITTKNVSKENRKSIFEDKLREFSSAKLVITDRLHGMVFCAITGTPCIVFSNYNQKVKGTYEWISYLSYIRYVETLEDAYELVPQLLSMGECIYDNSPLQIHFDKIRTLL